MSSEAMAIRAALNGPAAVYVTACGRDELEAGRAIVQILVATVYRRSTRSLYERLSRARDRKAEIPPEGHGSASADLRRIDGPGTPAPAYEVKERAPVDARPASSSSARRGASTSPFRLLRL